MNYGYVRVSTKEQNEDRQVLALKQFSIIEQNIYIDKISGQDFNRPAYSNLIKKIKPGDLMAVKSIDRLGRNYEEIIEQWRLITKDKKVDIVVLDMPLLDTRRDKDLMGTLISDIVLQLLSYVAQTERELIRQRQAEGIAAARQRGVKFGRPPKEIPISFDEISRQYLSSQITSRAAAAACGVPQTTFLRWVKKYKIFD